MQYIVTSGKANVKIIIIFYMRHTTRQPVGVFMHQLFINRASRGAAAQSVTVNPTGCGFDPYSRRWNIYLNLYFHFFALVSRQTTQHAMPPEFDRKWGTECLNTRFRLPTLLFAGYSVKLFFLFILFINRSHTL